MMGPKRRKIGHIVQRGNAWYVPVYLGRELVDGKWKEQRRWERFASYHEAREALPNLCGRAAKRTLARASNERLDDYLHHWLKKRADELSPKTAYGYELIIDAHLIPALGQVRLRDLEPEHIEDYLRGKRQGKKDADGQWVIKPLSATTVLHHFTLLHKALADAVRGKRLPENPTNAMERPKQKTEERRVLDEEQSRLFLAAARKRFNPYDYVGHRNYVLFLTAMGCGLRSAELAGLRRQDVNLPLGEVEVKQTFYRLPPKRWVFKPPKSEKGLRSVPLLPQLVKELRVLFTEQDVLREGFGEDYHDLGEHGPLVFAQPNGLPMFMHNLVRRTYKKILKDAKLPMVTLHDLRHGFATLHGRAGTPPRVLQELIGHSSVAFTLSQYQHVFQDQKDRAQAALAATLIGKALIPSNESSTETVSTGREMAGTGEKETA